MGSSKAHRFRSEVDSSMAVNVTQAAGQAGEDQLTRDAVASLLRAEGYSVSKRTIRYWENSGLLPCAVRAGRRVVHNANVLLKARLLAVTSPRAMAAARRDVINSIPSEGSRSVSTVEQVSLTEFIVKVRFKPQKGKVQHA